VPLKDTGKKGKKGKKGGKKEKDKKKKGKKGKKKGKGEEVYLLNYVTELCKTTIKEDEGIVMAPSKFMPTIQEGFTSYAGNWNVTNIQLFAICLVVQGVWQHRDETGNFLQKHDVEIVKEEKRFVCVYVIHIVVLLESKGVYSISTCIFTFPLCRTEIEKEVRVHVDELMREELKNLKLVTTYD